MKRRVEAAGLVASMAVVAVNIPIGATVAGLWVASRLTGEGQISMLAVGAFVVVAGGLAIGLTLLLGRLGARHDVVVGRPATARRHAAWMRPMSGERPLGPGTGGRAAALDVVCVCVVVVALLAFEAWFMFASGSPLDQGSGRG